MCNCGGGGGAPQRQMTIMTNGQTASVERKVPGMPEFVVRRSSRGDQQFATYEEARLFKARYGGKIRVL